MRENLIRLFYFFQFFYFIYFQLLIYEIKYILIELKFHAKLDNFLCYAIIKKRRTEK